MANVYRQVEEFESLNDGQEVVFQDGDTGIVVIGSTEKSLISYTPAPETGCTGARGWFRNVTLKVR